MRVPAIIIITFFAVSCASGYSSLKNTKSEEELLRERVTLFFEAKKSKNWEAAKEFVDPALRDEISPYLDSLKTKRTARMVSFNIKETTLDADKATVITDVTLKVDKPPITHEAELRDSWIKKDNLWYIIMKRPNFSNMLKKMGINTEGGEE